MKAKHKLIFFDLGGVVFQDIFSGGHASFVSYLGITKSKFLDIYTSTDDLLYSIGQINDEDRWRFFIKGIGDGSRKLDKLIQLYLDSYSPIEETVDFLEKIKKDYPNVILGILSDQPRSVANLLRKKYNTIFSMFDEDYIFISSEVGLSKRDSKKKLFKYALKKSNSLSPIYIDDSMVHLKKAREVGLNGYFFDINNKSPNKLIDIFFKKYFIINN